ncbi:hypothetical protein GC167_10705 [bacterium]|nr:hypothetical protein [bacterium]
MKKFGLFILALIACGGISCTKESTTDPATVVPEFNLGEYGPHKCSKVANGVTVWGAQCANGHFAGCYEETECNFDGRFNAAYMALLTQQGVEVIADDDLMNYPSLVLVMQEIGLPIDAE